MFLKAYDAADFQTFWLSQWNQTYPDFTVSSVFTSWIHSHMKSPTPPFSPKRLKTVSDKLFLSIMWVRGARRMITTVSYTIINQRDGLQNTNRKNKKEKKQPKIFRYLMLKVFWFITLDNQSLKKHISISVTPSLSSYSPSP